MKIFDWVHKNFLEKYTHATHTLGDGRSNDASLGDILKLDQFSRVKSYNGHGVSRSALKLEQNGIKFNEEQPCQPKVAEHYICSSGGEKKGGDGLSAAAKRRIRAIGTFVKEGTQSSQQKNISDVAVDVKDVSTSVTDADRMAVEEVEEFRKVMEKILWRTSCMEDGDASALKTRVGNSKNMKHAEATDNEDKMESRRRKSKNGKKVFPLREFLEIPHVPPSDVPRMTHTKKKKKMKMKMMMMMGGFRNLLNVESLMCGLYGRDDEKHETAKMELHQTQDTDKLPGVAGKLLHAFRKKSLSSDKSNNASPAYANRYGEEPLGGGKGDEEWCGQCEAAEEKSGMLHRMIHNEDGGNEKVGLQDYCYDNRCGILVEASKFDTLDEEDYASRDRYCAYGKEYGYWIKTDEEYVVLEL